MSGAKIIAALQQAQAHDFAAVTIAGVRWVRQGWQPIETAPLWEAARHIVVRGGEFGVPAVVRADGEYWAQRRGHRNTPTHWVSLPEVGEDLSTLPDPGCAPGA